MKTRQDIVEIFSTFLQLEAGVFNRWITDPKLRRSMQHSVAQVSSPASELGLAPVSEQLWLLHWHHHWQTQSHPLAADHLAAGLQEVCYWTARKITTNFARQQSLADLFQTAIAGLPKVLRTFNRTLNANLKSYAELIFGNLIKDALRKSQEVDICTDWSLLNRLSQKELTQALQFAGLSAAAIAADILAWNCFRELAAPNGALATRKQSKPAAAAWGAIANLYNQQRLTQLAAASPATTPEGLERRLLNVAAAVRALRLPTVVSANMPQYGEETVEILEHVPSSEEPLLSTLIAQEEAILRQSQKKQLQAVLQAAIAQLDQPLQTLLKTYYGQDLTQQQIAQQLGLKQYAISRQLTRARAALLRALAQWSQDTLHLSLTPQVLDSMDAGLEAWLQESVK